MGLFVQKRAVYFSLTTAADNLIKEENQYEIKVYKIDIKEHEAKSNFTSYI
jgi:hypothetical protein